MNPLVILLIQQFLNIFETFFSHTPQDGGGVNGVSPYAQQGAIGGIRYDLLCLPI